MTTEPFRLCGGGGFGSNAGVQALKNKFAASPLLARVLPFVVFLGLTFLQGQFGEASRYWVYLAKALVGLWLLWQSRPFVAEMKWAFSWKAVAVGVAVCVMWVGLDGCYPKFSQPGVPWNPETQFGAGSALTWLFIGVRVLGSALVVPPLEEVFYRSFVYRYLTKSDFLAVPVGAFAWGPFLVTSVVFGFEHYQWLAGILCGFAYQGLVCWKKRLGDAMTAHAITNFLLGAWVIGKGAWGFW